MKPLFYTKTLIALAVAVAAAAGTISKAQGQPAPPAAAADTGLSVGVVAGSPLSDVIKMLQAGVDAATIQSYIVNCQSAFNLDADKIVYLRDLGASTDLINAMMNRDKALGATPPPPPAAPATTPVPDATPAAPPAEDAPPAPAPDSAPDQSAAAPDPSTSTPDPSLAPPPANITLDYFNSSLAPYGSWINVPGYGQCWRPTIVIYNSVWNPYCDSGHWVYTDYGWYWDSDYAWGATFHYGRWFHDPRYGWCWCPDTVWAPSWVLWRSSDDYCGWAPLPPFTVFQPGIGFLYLGAAVGADFDFGLQADAFIFVAPEHFCDRRPRAFSMPQAQVAVIFRQTTVVNHYDVHAKTVVNRGFGTARIAGATHHAIEPVHVSVLANAGRQGWRGEGYQQTLRPAATSREIHPADTTGHNGPVGENYNTAGRNFYAPNNSGVHELNANEYPYRVPEAGNPRYGAETPDNRPLAPQYGQGAQPIRNLPSPSRQYTVPSQPQPRYDEAQGRGLTETHNETETTAHNNYNEPPARNNTETPTRNANEGPAKASPPPQAEGQHNPGNSSGASPNNKNNQSK